MIVVTGFEPFGGRRINRSWQAVQRVAPLPGLERVLLPVEFARLEQLVPDLARRRVRALLLVGEANRRSLSIERRARNTAAQDRRDNAGAIAAPHLEADGPAELAATWDVDRAVAAARSTGVRAELSDDAGTYCCNAALYRALRAAPADLRVGFLHVPAAAWPFGPRVARVARAIDAILATMVE